MCRDVINGNCRGGTTLSLLHEKTYSHVGEPSSQDLCLYLTQAACVPYFGMLEKWLYKGTYNVGPTSSTSNMLVQRVEIGSSQAILPALR